jgi:micrococcal nuclease
VRRAALAILFLAGCQASSAGDAFHVVDGDTLDLVGAAGIRERIRIENIDAPELFSPHCAAERDSAILAAARLVALVGEGEVRVERHGRDRYGRTLAVLSVCAAGRCRDIGGLLVAEGHARPWRGHRETWC